MPKYKCPEHIRHSFLKLNGESSARNFFLGLFSTQMEVKTRRVNCTILFQYSGEIKTKAEDRILG